MLFVVFCIMPLRDYDCMIVLVVDDDDWWFLSILIFIFCIYLAINLDNGYCLCILIREDYYNR